MEHPIIYRKKEFLLYCLIWLVNFSLLIWLLWYSNERNISYALIDAAGYMVPLFFLGLGLWYVVHYSDIKSTDSISLVIHHVAAAVIVVGLWISATWYFEVWWYGDNHPHILFWKNSIPWFMLASFLLYNFIVLFYYLLEYHRDFQNKLLRETELKNLVKEAELKALKSQINPHFLFNTLNSVSALTLSKPDSAREMVVKLSTFLRYSLNQDLRQKTGLINELNSNRLYLEIERVRFGDRLQFDFQVEKACEGMQLPNLILQPVFENAIKHGVHESTGAVTIRTACSFRNGLLRVIIGNNYDPEIAPKKGNGIGLKNIQERLKLIYNRPDLMKIIKTGNNFEVHLYFPQ